MAGFKPQSNCHFYGADLETPREDRVQQYKPSLAAWLAGT